MNTRFHYLYRDASNYKEWGTVTFSGAMAGLQERLMAALDSHELFIAHQVRVPELFFEQWPASGDDHCFHEFDSMEPTDAAADDHHSRSIEAFVEEVERAARSGWQVFDPIERRSGSRSSPSTWRQA